MTELLPITLLYVEDEAELREAVTVFLERRCLTVHTASDGIEALEKVAKLKPDLVVTDIRMPRLDGLGLAARLRAEHPEIPVIITTAFTEVDYLIRAIDVGISGFVRKPLVYGQLLSAIKKSAQPVIQQRRIETLRQQLEDAFLGRLGWSEAQRQTVERAIRAAESSYCLMLEGEAGTGKTHLAGLIHAMSRRLRGPFIVFDSAGLTVEQVELELFGRREKELGKLSVAAGGTILVRQTDTLPLIVQEKLARIIHEQRFFRISDPVPKPLAARIMATIRGDAITVHREGKLCEALYYLLIEQVISLPPLRTITEEIPRLAALFLQEAADDLHRPAAQLTDEGLVFLTGYPWPGNIRQLKSVMRRAAIHQGRSISRELLTSLLPEPTATTLETLPLAPPSLLIDDVEQWLIREALHRSDGRKMQAAELLGMEYKRFKRKMEKYAVPGSMF